MISYVSQRRQKPLFSPRASLGRGGMFVAKKQTESNVITAVKQPPRCLSFFRAGRRAYSTEEIKTCMHPA